MYDIVLSVVACLRAGTAVDVAWIVDADADDQRDPGGALAITPGGGRVGALLAGALDDQLADLAGRGSGGRIVDVTVGDVEALAAGLAHGGDVRSLLVPAAELPVELWELLADRAPVCLVTRLDGTAVTGHDVYTAATVDGAGDDGAAAFGRRTSTVVVGPDRVITVLWPVPKLVVVGLGPIADALDRAAPLVGWQGHVVGDIGAATGVIAALAPLDKVVVVHHDVEAAGRALAAALDSDAGYIGAVGSRRMQQLRADWLAYRGITDLDRIHGPAGLDIGARSPGEIAVAIVAEAVANTVRPTLDAVPPPVDQGGAVDDRSSR
jgi:xanthine dehydrogenase accessory factor